MTPSVSAAIRLAREACFGAMCAAGRSEPAASDRAAGNVLLARLLWHVPAWEGGFDGAEDALLEERAKRYGLTAEQVSAGLYVRGTWPAEAAKQAEAA